jgi:hypothetical protein
MNMRNALATSSLDPLIVAKWIHAIPINKMAYVRSLLDIDNLTNISYLESIYEQLNPGYQEHLIKPSLSSFKPSS